MKRGAVTCSNPDEPERNQTGKALYFISNVQNRQVHRKQTVGCQGLGEARIGTDSGLRASLEGDGMF